MNARIYDALLILFALACLGIVGSIDMNDAVAAEQLHCREKLNLRITQTADEAAGRCEQPEGTKK